MPSEIYRTKKSINLEQQDRQIRELLEFSSQQLKSFNSTALVTAVVFVGAVLLLVYVPENLFAMATGITLVASSPIGGFIVATGIKSNKEAIKKHKADLEILRGDIIKENQRGCIIGVICDSLSQSKDFAGPDNAEALQLATSVLEEEKPFKTIANFYHIHNWDKDMQAEHNVTKQALENIAIRQEIFDQIIYELNLSKQQKATLFLAVDKLFIDQISQTVEKVRERGLEVQLENGSQDDIETGFSSFNKYAKILPERPNDPIVSSTPEQLMGIRDRSSGQATQP